MYIFALWSYWGQLHFSSLVAREAKKRESKRTHTFTHRNQDMCCGNIRGNPDEIIFLQQCFSVTGYLQ